MTPADGTKPQSPREAARERLIGSAGAHASSAFGVDRRGEARLLTTPPLTRASMTPRPWNQNPLLRLAAALRRAVLGNRGRINAPGDSEPPPIAPGPSGAHPPGRARRVLLTGLILSQTVLATYLMTAVLPYGGSSGLELLILVLYALLFSWISAGFWTAIMGFFVLLKGGDRHAINAADTVDNDIDPAARTALLVPICNEDVRRVFAGVRATWDSLAQTGAGAHFDLYILSDSNDPDLRVAELQAWFDLAREVEGFGRIFYRRRTHRIKRKSGNIADWCRRWGSAYRYMVILDADSVMSGDCLQRLVQLMEAHPRAGIIQTAPMAMGRDTLYARIQQFASRVYGPLFTAGLHFWQLGESHYWGHNAILRVAPFMRHCALGRLPGRGGLSGEILSHDFVEAALMRRAGWGVWIAYDLPGSWEEMPPTLLDELKRDQRWCQGNLMNFRLFFTQGLHPAHRAVFMTGVMAYLSAPLWFASLVLSTALLAVFVLQGPVYFAEPYQLFPLWPQWRPEWAVGLFGGTLGLLLLPKLLAALLIALKPAEARGFGGRGRLFVSTVLEMLFSALLAPIRMLFHTRYVVMALLGLPVRWTSPPRDNAQTPWSEAIRRHGGGTVLGLAWLLGVYGLNPSFLPWLLPVAGSLVLAVPLSVISARIGLGLGARELRLFLTPEEALTPRPLRRLQAALRRAGAAPPGFADAWRDPLVNALCLLAERPRRNRKPRDKAETRVLIKQLAQQGADTLTPRERNHLLADSDALSVFPLPVAAPRQEKSSAVSADESVLA
ncbi:glucans biosynthesis glucosyltransferase MdoH [Polycyclovorans algicola]|uniref:glucans biosynthesis glucosyltransferase MdoH n=1 Tax=Polycyclovorans algicola TaxID=616992 RepID=UPI0006944676|nr:glucans biosynthesis glucosyltransferase MdoH [Polycyclovorans algicola]